MRKFVVLFLTFLSAGICAQSKRTDLQISTDDMPSLHGFSYWQQITVHAKDTSLTHRLHTSRPDVIKNLKKVACTVTVSSVFHHKVSKKVDLNKKSAIKFSLASFYTKASDVTMLTEKLGQLDTLYVLYSASDQSEKEKIGITKSKNTYTAIQYEGISNTIFQKMIVNEATYYNSVIKFEKEGRQANSPKAETAPFAEIYTIELNKEYCSFIVPGHWNGLNNLKAILFLVEKK